eukprot:1142115-Pyramimonas_sp.AAC.1
MYPTASHLKFLGALVYLLICLLGAHLGGVGHVGGGGAEACGHHEDSEDGDEHLLKADVSVRHAFRAKPIQQGEASQQRELRVAGKETCAPPNPAASVRY